MRRMRRALGPILATAALLGVLFVGVFPTRTYLAQRAATNSASHQLEVLEAQNEALAERIERLHDHAEIERLARERHNLVRPGEDAYAVLPVPGTPPAPEPEIAPAPEDDRNFAQRAWDGFTGLF